MPSTRSKACVSNQYRNTYFAEVESLALNLNLNVFRIREFLEPWKLVQASLFCRSDYFVK